MKGITIKARITLWYTIFLTLLTVLVLAVLFWVGESRISAATELRLKEMVSEQAEEYDEDQDYFEDGIYISFYNEEGYLSAGRIPSAVNIGETPVFREDAMQSIKVDGKRWLIYDLHCVGEEADMVWVRGMVSTGEVRNSLNVLLGIAAVVLPFFVALVALGGYYITKRAFAPMQRMQGLAREITEGQDLSRRIALAGGKDEMYQFAETFDGMLDRLENAFERERRFASDASHELRTPVSVIMTQCEYALRHAQSLDEAREHLEVISGQSKRMSEMVSQLLLLSRMEQGTVKISKEAVNISDIAEITTEEMSERAKNKGIRMHLEIEPGLWCEADETLLMRLFINLLDNAITYGRENGNVWLSLKKEGNGISGAVADDGIGIDRMNLDKIWERFYQEDPARNASEHDGAGLGLSMVKWIVNVHGGAIRVQSEPGKGSRFEFYFPEKNDF